MTKILIGNDGKTALFYHRLGLARAANAVGCEVYMWEYNAKPVFDAFDEFDKFDIFFTQSYNLNDSIIKCINERPNLKVIMRLSDWTDTKDKDYWRFPVLRAREDEIRSVEKIKNRINLAHIHHHPKWLDLTHNLWNKNLGLNVVSVMNAGDIWENYGGIEIEALKTQTCFLGGYWAYKSQTLDKYILPLCYPDSKIQLRIFGNQQWPTSNYCGFLDSTHVKDLYKSTDIILNVSERHSQVLGYDIISRPFSGMISGSFVLSDYVEGLVDLFPKGIEFGRTPEEYEEKIHHYLKYPDEREKIAKIGFEETWKNHTYLDRIKLIFQELKYNKLIQKCDEVKKKIKNG